VGGLCKPDLQYPRSGKFGQNCIYETRSSFSAIELQMKSGKRYRIGTDDPDNLSKALDEALNDA
jgi:hypothetical protein